MAQKWKAEIKLTDGETIQIKNMEKEPNIDTKDFQEILTIEAQNGKMHIKGKHITYITVIKQ